MQPHELTVMSWGAGKGKEASQKSAKRRSNGMYGAAHVAFPPPCLDDTCTIKEHK